jgi:hypothetical protein
MDMKAPISPTTINNHAKSLEMATRVTTNPAKQHTSRPASTEPTTSQVNLFYKIYSFLFILLVI